MILISVGSTMVMSVIDVTSLSNNISVMITGNDVGCSFISETDVTITCTEVSSRDVTEGDINSSMLVVKKVMETDSSMEEANVIASVKSKVSSKTSDGKSDMKRLSETVSLGLTDANMSSEKFILVTSRVFSTMLVILASVFGVGDGLMKMEEGCLIIVSGPAVGDILNVSLDRLGFNCIKLLNGNSCGSEDMMEIVNELDSNSAMLLKSDIEISAEINKLLSICKDNLSITILEERSAVVIVGKEVLKE